MITRTNKLIGLLLAGPVALGACTGAGGGGDTAAEGEADVAVAVIDEGGGSASSPRESSAVADPDAGSATDGDGTGDAASTAAPGTTSVAEITGDPAEFSTDLDYPADERAFIALDSARTTDRYMDAFAGAGNTLVVIDYQVYFNPGGNFFGNAIRLESDGNVYSPLNDINTLGYLGQVLNTTMVFEVPGGISDAQLEAGLPEGTPGGVTATFELRFNESLPYVDPGAGTLTPAEGTAVGTPAPMATDIRTSSGVSVLTVDAARITDREGEFFSSEGTKLVVAEVTLEGLDRENLFDSAFRLKADSEWYSPTGALNETIENGESINVVLVFEVAMAASTFTLEGGAPAAFSAEVDGFGYEHTGNPTASFDLVFS